MLAGAVTVTVTYMRTEDHDERLSHLRHNIFGDIDGRTCTVPVFRHTYITSSLPWREDVNFTSMVVGFQSDDPSLRPPGWLATIDDWDQSQVRQKAVSVRLESFPTPTEQLCTWQLWYTSLVTSVVQTVNRDRLGQPLRFA